MDYKTEDIISSSDHPLLPNNVAIFIAGATAGLAVDIAFYPIDTLKTRLQSQHGFRASGGFTKLFNKGLKPVILGGAPSAALFFVAYENVKKQLAACVSPALYPFVHMAAASAGELAACSIRVPIEVSKQRKQAFLLDKSKLGLRLLYRGYWSTVFRDIPFSLIQYPLWEFLQASWRSYAKRNITNIEVAGCGAIAGATSAAITTPLDVVKTRIMLANKHSHSSEVSYKYICSAIYKESGLKGFFAGFAPRITMITFGGFVYFGIYNQMKAVMQKIHFKTSTY